MVSNSYWIKCVLIVLLLICFQLTIANCSVADHENDDFDLGEDLYETLPIEHHRLHHQEFRRASLRYHPHVVYKKASLRPIIGQNGKISFNKRDRIRRSPLTSMNSE